MNVTEAALLMTMSDIAALARVQRPVVSVWRSRAAGSDIPFPSAVAHDRGQDLFDASQVGSWLADTGRGNNPDAMADAAAHAALSRAQPTDNDTFPVISALLALRSALGSPLSHLVPSELVDSADEHDPDDEMFFREIAGIGDDLERLARYVDDAVEAAYGEAAVFERLMRERFKLSRRELGEVALSVPAIDLMSLVVAALALTQSSEPIVVDVLGTSADTLVALANDENTAGDLTVITSGSESESARLLRRRLAVHRIPRRTVDVDSDGSFALAGNAVHLIQLPAGDDGASSPLELLSTIERIILQLDNDQLAVVLAPSAALSDAILDRGADLVRSDLLRSGRVRAIARLPVGLRLRKPQQTLSIWIVGEPRTQVDLAERWTMVADLTGARLDSIAITDLVSDLVASTGDLNTVRAHSFRFARFAFTRVLVASHDSLVASVRAIRRASSSAGTAEVVRVEHLISMLSGQSPDFDLTGVTIETTAPVAKQADLTVGQLIASHNLRYKPGNRLDSRDLVEGGTDVARIRIIGPAEVLGEIPLGRRGIDRLRFAGGYPAGRVTEPGDVIFCTTPRPAAMVDVEGTSVVLYPARILRIDPSDPNGLLAQVIAEDVMALASTQKQWKRWPLRRTDHRQRGALAGALASIRLQQQRARERLAQLDELSSLLISGVTAGTLTLSQISNTSAPSEGTN